MGDSGCVADFGYAVVVAVVDDDDDVVAAAADDDFVVVDVAVDIEFAVGVAFAELRATFGTRKDSPDCRAPGGTAQFSLPYTNTDYCLMPDLRLHNSTLSGSVEKIQSSTDVSNDGAFVMRLQVPCALGIYSLPGEV